MDFNLVNVLNAAASQSFIELAVIKCEKNVHMFTKHTQEQTGIKKKFKVSYRQENSGKDELHI